MALLGAGGRTAAAGVYHITYQLILVVYSVSGIYFTVVYPRLYRHLGDTRAVAEDFQDTARWLSLLAWAATPPLLLFAAPILRLIGGDALAGSANLLQILATMILLVPASAALNFLLPMDRLRTRLLCDIVGIAITAAGAALAALWNDVAFAAVMAVVGYAVAVALAHVFFSRQIIGLTAATIREFLSSGVRAGAAVLLVAWLPLPWWLGCATYLAVYALLLILTGHPVKDRLLHWRAALRRS